MRKYEIMFIVRADLDEKTVKDTVSAFEKVLTNMKSKIVSSKEMGQRKLAYPIKDQLRGFYYLLNVEASSEAIKEFDRKARIDENILRHLILKEEE